MEITLCVNNSEKNKLGKSLSNLQIFSGALRDRTSIINPVIIMEIENPAGFNYAYIPEFDRYYFIDDITSVRTGLWLISMKVDVLESFKNNILNVPVILSDSEETGKEFYLPGNVWKSKVKELTDIITFPGGLSDNGYFILITAGG